MKSIVQQLSRLRDDDLRRLSEMVHAEIRSRKEGDEAASEEDGASAPPEQDSPSVPAATARLHRSGSPRRAA
jgi:hypothetical protein